MADHITIKPQSESSGEGIPAVSGNQNSGLNKTQIISLCAAGLIASFFLPWANVLFGTLSGFDLQKLSNGQKMLWLIPVFCVITIVGGIMGKSQKIAAQVTGALPFLVLAYWLSEAGSDLMHLLSYGAYLSLGFGLALIVVPLRGK